MSEEKIPKLDNDDPSAFDLLDEEFPTECSPSFNYSNMTLIKQGAEARIYRALFLGRSAIVKERFSKKYRHPALDQQLTKDRIKSEVRCLARCRQYGVHVPTLLFVDSIRNWIVMEFIENSVTVREKICEIQEKYPENYTELLTPLAEEIGRNIGILHKNNIIHGDLTTSNMLLKSEIRDHGDNNDKPQLVFIDFGLSYQDRLAEDKGVDLYVLEKAFISTHPRSEPVFEKILETYWVTYGKGAEAVRKKLDEVRLRGRKRLMVG